MKEIKIMKTVSITISILGLLVGFFFSFLIASLNDAPGFVMLGGTITLVGVAFIYGLGEILIQLKKNNEILLSIQNELTKKK